jgi:hypothetical protein
VPVVAAVRLRHLRRLPVPDPGRHLPDRDILALFAQYAPGDFHPVAGEHGAEAGRGERTLNAATAPSGAVHDVFEGEIGSAYRSRISRCTCRTIASRCCKVTGRGVLMSVMG